MKTKGISSSNRLWLRRAGLIALLWVGQVLGTQGQIFIANYTSGTISEYSTGGALINAALISGLTDPISLALDGNGHIFVGSRGSSTTGTGVIGEYDLSGVAVNPSLITGLSEPYGMALDGNGHIFVANFYGSNIAEYATSGTVVNASLISFAAPSEVTSLALDGQGHLFVARYSTGTIGEYTTAGAPVHASLITGLHLPTAIALDGQGDLFVSNESNSTIGEYTTSGGVVNASLINLGPPIGAVSLALDGAGHLFTGRSVLGEYTTAGATVNAALISGLDNPWGLAVTPVPEPLPIAFVLLGSILLLSRCVTKSLHYSQPPSARFLLARGRLVFRRRARNPFRRACGGPGIKRRVLSRPGGNCLSYSAAGAIQRPGPVSCA